MNERTFLFPCDKKWRNKGELKEDHEKLKQNAEQYGDQIELKKLEYIIYLSRNLSLL